MKERILLVFDKGLGHGGVEAVIMSIVRNLSDLYVFDLLTNTSQNKHYDEEFASYGGKIIRVPFYEGKNKFRQRADYYIRGALFYFNCLRVIKGNMPYRAIHCHNGAEGGIVLTAAKKAGIPIRVMHSHAVFFQDPFIRKFITEFYRKLIIRSATCLVGCSKEACSLYAKSGNEKIIYNAYDDKRFNISMGIKKKDEGTFKLIQVGRYDRTKNQEFSLEVLREILRYIPKATLELVGSDGGEQEWMLKKKAAELGISEKVYFYKKNADIPRLLEKANAFLMPSLSEGFGIALVEAQAMGLKCYASDRVPEVTNCGGVVFLTIVDGAKVWAERIANDYQNNKCNYLEYDCTKFSVKSVMKEYVDLYGGNGHENRDAYVSPR